MSATITIAETNAATAVVTDAITNGNLGSVDQVNLDPVVYPITAGENSFEKWHRMCCSDAGGSSALLNWKVWASATPSPGCTLKTNARTSSYAGAQVYDTPSATDRSATYGYTETMPISVPATSNLGYGGTLGAQMDITSGLPKYTDYLIMQMQTTIAATAGTTYYMNYQWDEVA